MGSPKLTSPFMTKYEKVKVIIFRAKSLEEDSFPLIEEEELERVRYDPIEIAKIELERGLLNYAIKRELPSGKYETVHVNKLKSLD